MKGYNTVNLFKDHSKIQVKLQVKSVYDIIIPGKE